MNPLLDAARNLQEFFEQRGWRYCLIGGLALLRWGQPRFTRDVDLTLFSGFGHEEDFINPILEAGYRGRVADVAAFARRNRVLLIESPGGVSIDVALGGLPFEEEMVERSSLFDYGEGCRLRTCSAEDLVVLKLFAYRPQDVLDVETVVVRQRGALDWDYIRRQLGPLSELKEQPEIMEAVTRLRRRLPTG